MSDTNPPAPRPCASCPYRRDIPPGVWVAEEYAKLPEYDKPTGEQPAGVFMCHQRDGRVCAGWAGCHDHDETLALRLAVMRGSITVETLDAIRDYETDVPLFATGQEAADHGMSGVDDPDQRARRIIDGLTEKQRRR
jgi:hypothetical protein